MAIRLRQNTPLEGSIQLSGIEPWKEEIPPPGTIGYTHYVPTTPTHSLKPVDPTYTTIEKPQPICNICDSLGLEGTHPTHLCFANPDSTKCKPNI